MEVSLLQYFRKDLPRSFRGINCEFTLSFLLGTMSFKERSKKRKQSLTNCWENRRKIILPEQLKPSWVRRSEFQYLSTEQLASWRLKFWRLFVPCTELTDLWQILILFHIPLQDRINNYTCDLLHCMPSFRSYPQSFSSPMGHNPQGDV